MRQGKGDLHQSAGEGRLLKHHKGGKTPHKNGLALNEKIGATPSQLKGQPDLGGIWKRQTEDNRKAKKDGIPGPFPQGGCCARGKRAKKK